MGGVRYGHVIEPPAPATGAQGNPRGPNVGPGKVLFTVFCALGPGGRNCDFKFASDGPELKGCGTTAVPKTCIGSPGANVPVPCRSRKAYGGAEDGVTVSTE